MLQRPGKPDIVGRDIDCYLLDAPKLLAEIDEVIRFGTRSCCSGPRTG